jgi:hypothetical protein
MKLYKFYLIALLAGTLAATGCGDDGGSSNGGGGVDPNELCNVELCIDNATFKQVCIDEINDCIDAGGRTTEECVAFGTETCTV